MKASIKDLAKACNLSVSTVSRALNNQYGVSGKTKKLVEEKVKELGYVPNLGAIELVSKKSNLIGLILHGDDYEVRPTFLEILPYVNDILNSHQKDTIIVTLSRRDYQEGDLERMIQKRNLEGCIIFPGFLNGHPIFKDVQSLNVPIVVLEEDVIGLKCSNISTDDVTGAELAVKHLIESGHTNIGFINGPGFIHISKQRLMGYKRAHEIYKLQVLDKYIIESDYTAAGGAEIIQELLKNNPEITAVFFANDMMAMGAISLLAENGVKVPEELSVIGYDGMYATPYYNPPLTTIEVDYKFLGIRTATLLLNLLDGGTGDSISVMPKLIIRKSVSSKKQVIESSK